MRLRTFSLLSISVVIVTIVGVSWRGRLRSARTAAATDGPAAPSDDIAALRRDVALLKARSADPPPQVLMVPAIEKPKEEAEAPAAPPDPATASANAEAQIAQVTETLERKYATEPVDRSWGDKQTDDIRTAIGESVPGTKLASVKCASSLCKVVLQHETPAAQHEVASHVGGLAPMRAGVFYHYDDDPSHPRTTLYVLREGFDLNLL